VGFLLLTSPYNDFSTVEVNKFGLIDGMIENIYCTRKIKPGDRGTPFTI